MELDKKIVQEVVGMFNIKYDQDDQGEEESLGAVNVSANFSDLEGEVSSIISNMESSGEVLEVSKEEESKESKETEEKLETIEDIIATSVEEAKALSEAQSVQEPKQELESKAESSNDDAKEDNSTKESDAEFQEELDSISVEDCGTTVFANADELTGNAGDISNSVGSFGTPNIGHAETASEVEFKVFEEGDIDIIPQKDAEGNVKGELRMRNVIDISIDGKGKTIIRGGEIVWNSESPSELYNSFYDIKRNHIETFSGGEQLDFDSLYSELFGTRVDTATEVLDQHVLIEKMDAIMQCIERVAMIQVQINQQHFVWKRFVELLRGALARVQYLKPVLKQDGLILEHMGDVEFYADRLAAVKDSADKVMKTLEKAFESLSRKVSIMLTVQSKHTIRTNTNNDYSLPPQQEYQAPPSIVEERIVVSTKTPAEELGDYDDVAIGATVKSKPKSGEVSWDNIF